MSQIRKMISAFVILLALLVMLFGFAYDTADAFSRQALVLNDAGFQANVFVSGNSILLASLLGFSVTAFVFLYCILPHGLLELEADTSAKVAKSVDLIWYPSGIIFASLALLATYQDSAKNNALNFAFAGRAEQAELLSILPDVIDACSKIVDLNILFQLTPKGDTNAFELLRLCDNLELLVPTARKPNETSGNIIHEACVRFRGELQVQNRTLGGQFSLPLYGDTNMLEFEQKIETLKETLPILSAYCGKLLFSLGYFEVVNVVKEMLRTQRNLGSSALWLYVLACLAGLKFGKTIVELKVSNARKTTDHNL